MIGLTSVTPAQADTDPTYKFEQVLNPGKCLVVPNPAWPDVAMGSCDSGYARWRYYDGTGQLLNIGSHRCLKADGRKVTVQICNRDDANQRNWNASTNNTLPELGGITKHYATGDSWRFLVGWTGGSVSLENPVDLQGEPQKYLFWLRPA
ncbi:ricin-type beta-trefoil lectin domain protein [Streptomyces sp. AC627_RSS907]|uniref:ricin-type beta-trefoil lectin domain protein n=1 Tax=Streptomyces sp. AC627_RSS907 TaxID=2823684 RepID=UPI001C227706|nr:ricin-type beta-trefoil lectin domain protein [Streptomyces sp. AC627_RSS907]